MRPRWIDLDGVVNLRDLGGTPTVDGREVREGRLLRSDNLQSLSDGDVDQLLELGLTDVVDLRSDYEVESEGSGPLTKTDVAIHQHSLFREWRPGQGEPKPDVRPEALPPEALPWIDLTPSVHVENEVASVYLSYLADRPDSVVAALGDIADANGATLVHCAAGKDRTGILVALALTLVGVDRDEVVADYVASSDRAEHVVGRLSASPTYADNVVGRPLSSHLSRPESMQAFLEALDRDHGGVEQVLSRMGWSTSHTVRLRRKLLD